MIGDLVHGSQVVRRGDDGFAGARPAHQEIDHHTLAFRVEGGGWLIHQEHFGVKDQHGGQCYPFLLAPDSRCGGRCFRWVISNSVNISSTRANLRFGPAQLQGTKGDFIENRWVKKLDIRVLEHQSHALTKAQRERLIL